jgi:hypothetical protein
VRGGRARMARRPRWDEEFGVVVRNRIQLLGKFLPALVLGCDEALVCKEALACDEAFGVPLQPTLRLRLLPPISE